ncbi:MAG: LytTR family DNA-binding domain-containing protein [Bacteroidia bacterium]|jgi:DNA-binding LytR/AlgR family response regulator|nr:LytTR family DNA-binding domain-containing protein [Bacteroidia bacterium]
MNPEPLRIVVIEDETPAADRLISLIRAVRPGTEVLAQPDSVEESVAWFLTNPAPDLVFMDIHLADGISFAIFEAVPITAPVIFTTAYDQYALRAFSVNSLDYLLKPVDPDELARALHKHHQRLPLSPVNVQALLQALQPARQYQERFLVKVGDQYKYLTTDDIAYLIADEGTVWLVNREARRFPTDLTLEQLEQQLDPRLFFRINRQCMVRHTAILRIHAWFNSRLKLDLVPELPGETIVSRDRVAAFKGWLSR